MRPGAEFVGKQITGQKTHDVRIDIKHVDLENAVLCGYFEITRITEAIPTMCTYFEGEIIGSKFGFITDRKEWGATRESDLQHWERFPAFEGEDHHTDANDSPYLFMRWKELFLLPDSRRELYGASFSGFYYMCLNQITGNIIGYYYQRGQAARERYQSIELNYKWPKVVASYEFR